MAWPSPLTFCEANASNAADGAVPAEPGATGSSATATTVPFGPAARSRQPVPIHAVSITSAAPARATSFIAHHVPARRRI
jgi:hypothetical protein